MPSRFVHRREDGIEATDDSKASRSDLIVTLRDIRRANAVLGGTRVIVSEAINLTRRCASPLTLLDVGSGTGDVACAVARALEHRGIATRTIGVEQSFILGAIARPETDDVIAGDALALPVRDRGVDLTICSQVLHHFDDRRARVLIGELDRVSRVGVVIGELERDALASILFRAVAPALRFHPVTVRDGLLSIERGFSGPELRALVRSAVPREVNVRRRFPFRLTASWTVN
ncbi:MAG TPA: methyltransferase domain-containing protein [Gemmatimonadaceae bacterium]|nr:methyltransferase domain-containing protein [Gemmatimonadaceae bacterium]